MSTYKINHHLVPTPLPRHSCCQALTQAVPLQEHPFYPFYFGVSHVSKEAFLDLPCPRLEKVALLYAPNTSGTSFPRHNKL